MVKITLADDGDNIGGSNNVDSNDGVVYNIAEGDCGGHHSLVVLIFCRVSSRVLSLMLMESHGMRLVGIWNAGH
ncbi:hypothetical protein YC2023_106373 [Brassica napus]